MSVVEQIIPRQRRHLSICCGYAGISPRTGALAGSSPRDSTIRGVFCISHWFRRPMVLFCATVGVTADWRAVDLPAALLVRSLRCLTTYPPHGARPAAHGLLQGFAAAWRAFQAILQVWSLNLSLTRVLRYGSLSAPATMVMRLAPAAHRHCARRIFCTPIGVREHCCAA